MLSTNHHVMHYDSSYSSYLFFFLQCSDPTINLFTVMYSSLNVEDLG